MRGKSLYLVYLLLGLIWAGLLRATLPGDGDSAPPAAAQRPTREKHYVSPRQLAAAGDHADQPAPSLVATGHDGRTYRLAELTGGRPLVLAFLKDGCPCNEDVEPYLQQLFAHHRDHARFAAVIDGTDETARRYAAANGTPYPVLADADGTIIRAWHIDNGGYIALVRPDGTIDQLWPGYSQEMFRELSQSLAQLAAVPPAPLDVQGLPTVLTTGCPYH